jgi:RimJ/RimL family protein N-acetyltransferase
MQDQAWLSETQLVGKTISLKMLEKKHAPLLVEAAADGQLWDLWFTSIPSVETVDSYIDFALNEKRLGRALAFVVVDNKSGKIIGSTRFCNAEPLNKRVEIGHTWYAKSYQKTRVNSECKYLLLQYAFESLLAIAVEFRTHWHNQESRVAISRLGAKQDGLLRNAQKDADGCYRDTVVFSIIDQEWPAVRKGLSYKLGNHLRLAT